VKVSLSGLAFPLGDLAKMDVWMRATRAYFGVSLGAVIERSFSFGVLVTGSVATRAFVETWCCCGRGTPRCELVPKCRGSLRGLKLFVRSAHSGIRLVVLP
jgi:hypothetical protein